MKAKKIVTNFLIVGYLAIIYFSGVPESNTLNFRLKNKAVDMAFILGIWPSWSMFAPNPIKFDTRTFVEISYKNGETKDYNVEIETKGLLAPFRQARWQKYSQDNLRNPKQKALWAPAIRFFKEKYKVDGNPIVSIKIKRIWEDVPPYNDQKLVPLWEKFERKANTEILTAQNYEI